MRKFVLALAALAAAFPSVAQISYGGEPIRWNDKSIPTDIPVVSTSPLNLQLLSAQDALTDPIKEAPYRFGIEVPVSYSLENSGRWIIDANSDVAVWQLGVDCPDATSISFELSKYNIPEGAKLFIWNGDRSAFLGAFTQENMNAEQTFGIGLLHGSRVFLEYVVPTQATTWGEIEISTIVHGYRSILAAFPDADRGPFGSSGACNINVNCPAGADWQVEKRSVALIVQGGSAICSGALVNNTAQDGTPYFLTANHCLGGGVNNWVFYFNHESASCSGTSGPTNQSISGATLRASNAGSDFALLELNDIPPASFNAYYAGWDNSDLASANTGAVGIHHPAGDVKKICFEEDAPYQNNTQGAAVWYIDEWESGVTEGGSSGSPLFNQNKRIIGQLYGGFAACAGSVNNGEADWYGRFGVSWDNGTSNSTRLSNWLDPLNLGVTFLDGFAGESYALDAAAGGINGIAESVCGTSGNPVFVLRNNGTSALTSATITVSYNGTVVSTINWTGNLNQGQQEEVDLPVFNFADGENQITVAVTAPNGQTDQSVNNNTSTYTFTAFIGETTSITINLEFDFFPEETAWELLNETGQVVTSSNGFYAGASGQLSITECVPFGCYSFVMIDDYGDGMCAFGFCGSYSVVDADGNELASGGEFEDEEITDFCLENSVAVKETTASKLTIYPNPSNGMVRVEGIEGPGIIEIFDITGHRIVREENASQRLFDLSGVADGVYLVKATYGGESTTQKLVIRK